MSKSSVDYTSKVHIVRKGGPVRATLPGEAPPVTFRVRRAIAEHYQVSPAAVGEPHAATIDCVIAATAG